MLSWLCLPVVLLTASPIYTAERVYTAPIHQSVWYAQFSPHSCELSHPVPLYGVARFRHAAGGTLQFDLAAHDAAVGRSSVWLSSEHPRWNHLARSNDIARVSLQTGGTPVTLTNKLALRLLLELENGMQGVFRYQSPSSEQDSVVVRLSNVNFADAMRQFRFCIGRLSGNDPVAIARIEVRFALNSATLGDRARPHLDRVAAKVAADPGINRIVLTGYADRSGAPDYNLELSQRRARKVLEYLTDLGVKESLLEVVAMGESAAADEQSTTAQRQVIVEILR